MNIKAELSNKILRENILEHQKEARFYDLIHTEIFNSFEQQRISRGLSEAIELLSKDHPHCLDVGAGTGNIALKLLGYDAASITGVDLSKEMLSKLREKLAQYKSKATVKLIARDIDSFLENNDQTFDFIVISSVLHHLPDYYATIKNLQQVLRPGGVIFITHEPFRCTRKKGGLQEKMIKKLDYAFYFLRYLMFIFAGKLKYLNRDCHYSDFHTGEKAINIKEFAKSFDDNYKLSVNKFAVAKFALSAKMLNRKRLFNNFEIIVKKNA